MLIIVVIVGFETMLTFKTTYYLQACYSLGNTYTLLKNYPTAVEYHLRHLRIAQELFDKVRLLNLMHCDLNDEVLQSSLF